MKLSELAARARVTERGAIVFDEVVAVDGHHRGAFLRVVTHAHVDHLIGLRESVKETPLITCTRLTYDMALELGYRIPESKYLELNYNTEIDVDGLKLKLLPANHIPGAAQVLVETRDGLHLGYTGDFKQPGTPVMKDLDVLVIEATYGKPEYRRPWSNEIDYLLADLVRDLLSQGPVYIYGYHGKLQEVMRVLRTQGIDAPFVAPPRVYRVTMAVKRHGVDVGEVLLDSSPEGQEVMRSGWYIYFTHMNSRRQVKPVDARASHVILSGWEFSGPYRKLDERTWVVSYSDHADFDQLVSYVEEAKPKLLVVDAYREGAGEYFASFVRRRLGIPAVAMPMVG